LTSEGKPLAAVKPSEGLNPLKYHMNPRAVGRPPLNKGPVANVTLDDDTMVKDYFKTMDWGPNHNLTK